MSRRSLNPFREIYLVAWLIFSMVRMDIKLVHGFTVKCAVYGSIAARLSGGRPSIGAIAGLGYVFSSDDVRARFLRPVVRMLMRLSFGGTNSALILQNPDDFTMCLDQEVGNPQKMHLIKGSGVDLDRFSPQDECAKNRKIRVLLPARLLWDKGVLEYVEMAKIVNSEQGVDVEFLLAGESDNGNPAAVPEAAVIEWESLGYIRWLGKVENMPNLYRSVDIVVLPSYREGLPKGLIEAAACCRALVTTDVPGCREVVTHAVNGLLVPPKNSVALAEAVTCLIHDAGLRERLGSAARAKALKEYGIDYINSRTISIYDDLLGRAS